MVAQFRNNMTDQSRDELKQQLLSELNTDNIPAHIAIIMDGNGRWAKQQGKARVFGHQEGVKTVKKIVKFASKIGVKHLSIYAFSVENWARPSFEVSALMRLLKTYLIQERNELHENQVVFRLVGRVNELAPEIIKEAEISTELMKNNTGMSLDVCVNYGGRAELVDAVKNIINEGYKAEDITEDLISQHMYCPEIPDVDLMIRTSGEYRISNFHMWRSAYSELYFTPVLWPDFDEVELLKAVLSYQNRERRFGMTSEQVQS